MSRRRWPTEAPLFEWGESQQGVKARHSQLLRRIAITCAGIAIVLLSAGVPPTPRLVWNSSTSAPVGLYAVTPGAWAEPGDVVVASLPEHFRQLAAERHYLPLDVPLVKRVAAYGGDKVCANGKQISINDHTVTRRRAADARGRPMPMWNGCVRLHGRQIFLLNDNPASFDGRYFGVTEGKDVIGKAKLLWRRR